MGWPALRAELRCEAIASLGSREVEAAGYSATAG